MNDKISIDMDKEMEVLFLMSSPAPQMNDKISIDMDKEMEELSFSSPAPQMNDKISIDMDKDKEELFFNSPAPQVYDKISVDMDKEMKELSSNWPDCCIFRVHDELRNKNRMAYDPTLIAIGPYHKSNVKLQMMEEHKLRYLKLLLQRINMSINDLVIPIKSLEEKARKCYAEPINLDSESFIRMLILDGCFIIYLALKYLDGPLGEENDPIFRHDWMLISLERDLMLFENQLPFFVLREIYDIIKRQSYQLPDFNNIFDMFFKEGFPVSGYTRGFSWEYAIKVKHLLEFIHFCWLGPPTKNESEGVTESFIGCATKLKEANVKFKKLIDAKCGIFDIGFSGGVFEFPQLRISDATESFLRNMIAFEEYGGRDSRPVTCYVTLMDNLINTSKDVELLCHCGIIDNWLGDDEVVAEVFNKLTDNVTISSKNFLYGEISKNVNAHCERPYNKQIASLRHNYLNSPWALISVLAGSVLLILTITQTVFTIFPRK